MRTIIKIVVLLLIVLWVYGLLREFSVNRKVIEVMDDPCQRASYINNCIVLKTYE